MDSYSIDERIAGLRDANLLSVVEELNVDKERRHELLDLDCEPTPQFQFFNLDQEFVFPESDSSKLNDDDQEPQKSFSSPWAEPNEAKTLKRQRIAEELEKLEKESKNLEFELLSASHIPDTIEKQNMNKNVKVRPTLTRGFGRKEEVKEKNKTLKDSFPIQEILGLHLQVENPSDTSRQSRLIALASVLTFFYVAYVVSGLLQTT